jgi:hypothetical protein
MRSSRDPHPSPTPSAPQNSAVPPPFAQDAKASLGPTAEPFRTFAHLKNLHTDDDDDAAISNPGSAQAKSSSRAATPSHPRDARVNNGNTTMLSTPPAASFLGVSLEVRCMIYGYLWTQAIDIYIDSSPSNPQPNAAHPLFLISHQVRMEALDGLRRTRSLTFNLHAAVHDIDFSKLTRTLEDLSDASKAPSGAIRELHVVLSLQQRALKHAPPAPKSLEGFVQCLRRLGLSARYTCVVVGFDGVERSDDSTRLTVKARLRRWLYRNPWSLWVRGAVVGEMAGMRRLPDQKPGAEMGWYARR